MDKDLKDIARELIQAGIEAVRPRECVRRALSLEGEILRVGDRRYDLREIEHIYVVGFGKASAGMARAVEDILSARIAKGLVITADGYRVATGIVEVREAGHPIPDGRGIAAAEELLSLVQEAGERDLVLILISGGGSALLTAPAEGISLEDLAATNALLLRCGATIQEINAVRKHLSRAKGGQLARLAQPARVVSLVLSDVVGDPLDSIASGPTVPDPTTFADAIGVLRRYGIWEKVPESVRRHLQRGASGMIPETPKPGDPCFSRVQNVIVGSGRHAAEAALKKGEELGFTGKILTTTLEGEAREVGKVLAAIARELRAHGRPLPPPALLVLAGETTVTVRGGGKGGRNQELALSAALGIDDLAGVVIASVGTDGRDGPTDAAGGIVDGGTARRIRDAGLDPEGLLRDNDSYRGLSAAGDLLVLGPTGTNVADLLLILAG
ncbi:glycerate kinase type-2 family protein [Candidatus Bipolaricaulota sp. J31]